MNVLKKAFTYFLSVKDKEWHAQAIVTEQVCPVYCLCRLPEHHGSMMIQCDKYHDEWYHSECVNTDTLPTKANETDEWYCPCCHS